MKTNLSLLIVFITMLATQSGKCQSITNNNVFFELGGAAFFYSVNYERLWLKNTESNIATRIGVMYIPIFPQDSRQLYGVPVSVSYLNKLKKNYFEVGASVVGLFDKYDKSHGSSLDKSTHLSTIPSVRVGIRRQPSEAGLFWNALIQGSLIIINSEDSDVGVGFIMPYASFGIGRAF